MKTTTILASLGLFMMGALAPAGVYSTEASHNVTVQPAGPRQGANGLRFFNIEGNNYGAFASYGVTEFNVASLGIAGTVTDVSRLTLRLVAANAAFSYDGVCNIWLTSDTITSAAQSGSPLFYDANFLWDGLGTQLDTKWNLGQIMYEVAPGSGATFWLDVNSMSPASKAYLINQLNNGSIVRMIVSPNENFVAATFAGYDNSTYSGPVMEVDVVETTVSVSGIVNFTDRFGNFPGSIDIDFQDASHTIVHTAMNVAVDSMGNFSTTDLPPTTGSYFLSVKRTPWLRRTIGPYNTGTNQSGLVLDLVSGDIDGDNEVAIGDYAQLSTAFNSEPGDGNWNPDADLNGDDSVDIGDFAILSVNFGVMGDD
ncbi:MAG TPA: hypothetical protein PLL78_11535 [Fimbriimonadaceae bacterium]|nr:hypothetical protein [Fimbriimonadaceae bacterium]HRJ97307.1 hypothetical protein [Fimbriimonadaceae bacterium]